MKNRFTSLLLVCITIFVVFSIKSFSLSPIKELIKKNIEHIILMMEFVPAHLKQQNTNPEALIQFLKLYKFSCWRIGKKNLGEPLLVPVSYKELINIKEADILASRKPII